MVWLYYCGFVWSVSALGLVCLLAFRLVLLDWLCGLFLYVGLFGRICWVLVFGFLVWDDYVGVFVICL